MDNSIYVTLSGQLTLFHDMEATANNVANAETAGYDADHILFNSYVTQDVNQGNRNPMAFATEASTYRDITNGPMKVTGRDLDVAIQGEGYFEVETPLGIRYTRAGNFQIGADGTLVSAEGYPVLDNSGQHILLPDDTDKIDIGAAGNLKVNGEDFGSLGIVRFDHPQLLERMGNRLFKSDAQPSPADSANILQGTLEGSNVQPILEMTHMVDLSHQVANTAQLISVVYDLETKTADAWAQQL
ncbi:MAG: flagellar basal-body rod protein FlgF [Pseudomonadota bacterium]|nr:flagellar basal-body rod protein FlgF [Pseudomonadota bacterium]MDE3038923.1 flagellar basal-body rod protein FlgF [Pseudomonadota bacterium]